MSDTLLIKDILKHRDEILKKNPPYEFWVRGFDLLEHVLRADLSQTLFQNRHEAHRKTADEVTDIIEEYKVKSFGFHSAEEKAVAFRPKSLTRWSDRGELDVEAYLSDMDDPDPDCFTEIHTEYRDQPAIAILLDASIAWAEREGGEVAVRHQKVYDIALRAEEERRPCLVATVLSVMNLVETYGKNNNSPTKHETAVFNIIKDYDEPIFPGIWGGYSTNKAANNMAILTMAHFIGTSTGGLGTPADLMITDHFDGGNVDLVEAQRIMIKGGGDDRKER